MNKRIAAFLARSGANSPAVRVVTRSRAGVHARLEMGSHARADRYTLRVQTPTGVYWWEARYGWTRRGLEGEFLEDVPQDALPGDLTAALSAAKL